MLYTQSLILLAAPTTTTEVLQVSVETSLLHLASDITDPAQFTGIEITFKLVKLQPYGD